LASGVYGFVEVAECFDLTAEWPVRAAVVCVPSWPCHETVRNC